MNKEESDEWIKAAASLKSYVTANDEYQYSNVSDDMLILDLSHSNLKQKHIEIRFYKHDTINTLRNKIYQKTGTPSSMQYLQIYSSRTGLESGSGTGEVVCEIPPDIHDDTKLGYFSLYHGYTIHCIDMDPYSKSSGGQLEDTSLVMKYVMSDETYNLRKNTLRSWEKIQKEKNPNFTLRQYAKDHREIVDITKQYKLGYPLPDGYYITIGDNGKEKIMKDYEYFQQKEEDEKKMNKSQDDDNEDDDNSEFGKHSIDHIQIDQRCQVQPGSRRGKIAFVGKVPELSTTTGGGGGGGGYWVGVIFDEPVGKSNGTIKGKTYFDAMDKYAGFIRGKNIQIGDFPPELDDLFSDSSDDDEDEDEL